MKARARFSKTPARSWILLCRVAREIPGCFGARLTGGGFGGAILALAAVEAAENVAADLAARVKSSWGIVPQVLITAAGGSGA
jgi:galactokinase